MLILDVFARHARSREGKLQVELAQLRYRQSNLIGVGADLSRLGGGIGTRGPGETKLEVDRRRIAARIAVLRRLLAGVRRQRAVRRSSPRSEPLVALVGYTNVGKSSLLNALARSNAHVADQPFATLDPTIRRAYLAPGAYVRLADTVGFITDLPEDLINAFRATLEELEEADLLLHVLDASSPQWPSSALRRRCDPARAAPRRHAATDGLQQGGPARSRRCRRSRRTVCQRAYGSGPAGAARHTGGFRGEPAMTRRAAALIAPFLTLVAFGCGHPDDAFVTAARRMRPAVVLLTMKIPPEHKKDRYDEAYATAFVVASGDWGSDLLTAQHAIDGAWDLHITVSNRWTAPARVVASNADLDVALLHTPRRNLPFIALRAPRDLQSDLGREVGLLGYPVPDEFDDEGLGLATSLGAGRLSSVRKDALEVTLPVVPGESGAPVFIADTGEVIGLAESRFDDEPSIGFAVPLDDLKKFLHRSDAGHGF